MKHPQLTETEELVLKTLTPRGTHGQVCDAIHAKTGWDASDPINRLLELELIQRVSRGHYEARVDR
jgi:hypothetical protein